MSQQIDLSIVLPAIRRENWVRVYESFLNSAKTTTFEVIIVSPYDLPSELQDNDNITFIKDFGSPTRCQQRGLCVANGKYVTECCDDGLYLEGTIDRVVNLLVEDGDRKTIVSCKYCEGNESNWHHMSKDIYYHINHHDAIRSKYVEDHWIMFSVAFFNRDYLMELGGWDSAFATPGMAHQDVAVRAQRDGAKVILTDFCYTNFMHFPGTTGDHAPIHFGHTKEDEPLYKKIYSSPDCVNRIKIDPNNWKDSPEVC